jgi:hypothetical protein
MRFDDGYRVKLPGEVELMAFAGTGNTVPIAA